MSVGTPFVARPITPELSAAFRNRAHNLQMLPAVAVKALEITRDPECTISEFTAVVERDTKLATDMLGMANSAMFASSGQKARTLNQAVIKLGFRQCRNLILSTGMAALMKKLTLEEEWIRDGLTKHGVTTGLLAICVNRVTSAGFQGEEFAAGLIHDVGRILLAVCLPQKFSEIDPMNFEESVETLIHEQQVIGSDHCEAGVWLAQQNQLPPEFTEVIRYHHRPAAASHSKRLVALIAVCDHMANFLQNHGTSDGYDIESNDAISVLAANGLPNAIPRMRETHADMMKMVCREAHLAMSL